MGRRPEHLQGTLQHSPEDLALCSTLLEINVILQFWLVGVISAN